jgi:hypothetical protein
MHEIMAIFNVKAHGRYHHHSVGTLFRETILAQGFATVNYTNTCVEEGILENTQIQSPSQSHRGLQIPFVPAGTSTSTSTYPGRASSKTDYVLHRRIQPNVHNSVTDYVLHLGSNQMSIKVFKASIELVPAPQTEHRELTSFLGS